MMRSINSKLDIEKLEREVTALLFIEAEWSIYAVRAKNIIESLECELNNAVPIYSSNKKKAYFQMLPVELVQYYG